MGMSKAEKERLKTIIGDTITLLCRNSIQKFDKDFNVEGLIGITVDSEDLVLVSIKESVRNPNAPVESEGSGFEDVSDSAASNQGASPRKRKRKRNKRQDGESSPKVSRPGHENDSDFALPQSAYSDMGTPHNSRASNLSHMENSRSSYSGDGGMSNDGSSGITLQEVKHDSDDDDDLIEIIKEEPGEYRGHPNQGHIVSIQSLHQSHPGQSFMNTSMNSQGLMPAEMPPGAMATGVIPNAGLPPMPLAPGQTGDLNEQVELMPGSGVFVKRATYNQLQFIDKGSKLVRKLVREIFPDVHLLASSSCMGKGETSPGLDRHKVEVIKAFSNSRLELTAKEVDRHISSTISTLRQTMKKREARLNRYSLDEKTS